jgi:hypothetical protein
MLSSVSVDVLKRLFTGSAGFLGRIPPTFAFHIGDGFTGLGILENGVEVDLHQLLTLGATQAASISSETEIDMKNGQVLGGAAVVLEGSSYPEAHSLRSADATAPPHRAKLKQEASDDTYHGRIAPPR